MYQDTGRSGPFRPTNRECSRGEDSAATALLRHITEKPFRLLASTQVRRSQEVRDFVNSMIRVPFRWMRLFRDLLYQLHLEPGPAVD